MLPRRCCLADVASQRETLSLVEVSEEAAFRRRRATRRHEVCRSGCLAKAEPLRQLLLELSVSISAHPGLL